MAKSLTLKSKIRNIAELEVDVSELPKGMHSKSLSTYNGPLYCIRIDEKILKTPMGNPIVHEDLHAMEELQAEIDSLDELDVQALSLLNLLCTQIDFVEKDRQEFTEKLLREALWNDPVLQPLTGPEVLDQLKYLGLVKDFLIKHELEYPNLPQISFEYSTEFLDGNHKFEKLIDFVKRFLPRLNSQQFTVFVTTAHLYDSPVLGLMLATKSIDAYQFANIFLKMQGVSSKIDREINREEERILLETYKKQANLMIQYLDQFSTKQTDEFNESLKKTGIAVKNSNTFRYLLQTAIDLYTRTQKRSFNNVLDEMNDQLGYGHISMTIQKWLSENTIPNSAEVEYFAKKITRSTELGEKWIKDLFSAAGYQVPNYLIQAEKRSLRVFLCHSSGDKPEVRKIYSQLNHESWIDPWLDEEKILPGEDWDSEIKSAVRAADTFIVCLSSGSVNKEGYVQKEIRQALDIADEKPEGTIFIVPLKLEPCDVPNRLSPWQWVNYYEKGAYNRLILSLKKRAHTLGIQIGQ
jgi:chaperone required for assembly of F1-ATPase